MALLLVAVKRLVDEHLGELPVSAVGLQSQEPDVGEVDDVFAVDSNEAERLEQRCHGDFLARLGHQAHGLAADRMSWLGGVWMGIEAF